MKGKRVRKEFDGKVTKKWVEKEIHKLTPPVELKQVLNQPGLSLLDVTVGNVFQVVNPVVAADLQQGTAHNQRVGDVIYVKKIDVRFDTVIANGGTDAPVREIMFYDTQSQGTAFGVADLFYIQGGLSAGYTHNQMFNEDLVGPGKRFRILHDKTIDHRLPFTAVSASTECDYRHHIITKHYKGKGLKVQFYQNTALGGIAALESGAITLFLIPGGLNNSIRQEGMTKTLTYTDA